jgi:hypothetical protein
VARRVASGHTLARWRAWVVGARPDAVSRSVGADCPAERAVQRSRAADAEPRRCRGDSAVPRRTTRTHGLASQRVEESQPQPEQEKDAGSDSLPASSFNHRSILSTIDQRLLYWPAARPRRVGYCPSGAASATAACPFDSMTNTTRRFISAPGLSPQALGVTRRVLP